MTEGYAALYLAIIKGVSPEMAFKMLDGKRTKREWTIEDIKKMDKLRLRGVKWKTIAEIMGSNEKTIQNVFKYYKRQAKNRRPAEVWDLAEINKEEAKG